MAKWIYPILFFFSYRNVNVDQTCCTISLSLEKIRIFFPLAAARYSLFDKYSPTNYIASLLDRS